MRRPDRFYSKMTGGRGLESWYNGKTVTIASHPEKVFAQAPMPDTIDRTLDALAERYDMALPLAICSTAPRKRRCSPTRRPAATSAPRTSATRRACTSRSRTRAWNGSCGCPHRATPLPKRFKVVQKGRTGQPVVDVTFTKWDFTPQIADATFVPKVPAEYEGIAVVQRAAAIKHTAAATAEPEAAAKK